MGRVYSPLLTVATWAVAVVSYTSYSQGLLQRTPRPLVTAGVIFALVAAGMAIADKPRRLIACAMLTFPTWMLGAGVFYIGFTAGYPEFVVWSLASIVAAAALAALGLSVASASGRRSAQ